MKLNRRRTLAAVAATGVASGALAFGGVTLAAASSAQSPAAATAALAATPATTATPAPTASGCDGGPGGLGFRPGPLGVPAAMKAVAAYLGLSQDQLRAQLAAGKSLADVATARGKSVSGLKTAILAAGTSQIDASSWLTAAQKATLVSWLKDHLDAIVNTTFPDGPGAPWTGWPPMGGPLRGGGWPMGGPPGV
jgi:hypothetical protein